MATETGLRSALARVRTQERTPWGIARRFLLLCWRLTVATVRICLRYRVTGLSAEAGFFALLSLPPLLLGLVGSLGFVGGLVGEDVVSDLRGRLSEVASSVLNTESVTSVILPTYDQVVGAPRADIISIGFLLSFWSGSRALNVFIDTISIMYGLGGERGIVRTRVLSLSMYTLTLLAGTMIIPIILVGPALLSRTLASIDLPTLARIGGTDLLYWPVVSLAAVAALATLYHIATPVRSPWRRDLPGAVLALVLWLLVSYLLRVILGQSVDGASIYGPLAAPIVVLIWLYFLAISVLIGAALNAAVDERYPTAQRVGRRAPEVG